MEEKVLAEEDNKVEKTIKCLNCGTEFQGKFCPECGQRADTGRFTIKFIFTNFLQAILSNDGGIWITLKSLFTRPGQMMVDIINGKFRSYFSPFPMLFLTLSLYVVIFTFTGSRKDDFDWFDEEAMEVALKDDTVTTEQNEAQIVINKVKPYVIYSLKFYQNNYAFCYLFTIPVYILAARMSFGRQNRRRYNWGEYCIPIVYSLILIILYRCLMSIAFYMSKSLFDKMSDLMIIVSIVVFTACFKKMMDFNILKTVWRSLLTKVFYVILMFSLIGIICVIGFAIAYSSVS